MDVPAIIRLLAMHGAAVTEAALVGIGVDAEIIDHQDAGLFQPHADESGEIEHCMSIALTWQEEHCVPGIGPDETFDEFGADLIARLADQGADSGNHAASFRTELFHCLDGRFQDAGQRALPAGMRRPDHARRGIDEQDRSAIGCGDADGEPFTPRHDGVGLRPRRSVPWTARQHRIRRVDLVHADEMRGRDAQLFRHPAAVFGHPGRVIVRAEAAIEAGIDTIGHAAVAGEKSVAKPWNGRKQGGGKHQEAPADSLSSLRPGSEVRLREETPSTLNIEPMPLRPPPVNRFSAAEMSSLTSCDAFAINATARVSMPSRFRKSPCVTGPWTSAPTSSAARASAWKSTWAVTSACPGAFSGSVKL